MRKIGAIISAVVLSLMLSCSVDADSAVLSVAAAQEPPTLDVMVNTSVSGRNIVVGNVYERLFAQGRNGSIEPLLAESYELSDDGCTLTATIRDGVVFHDGTPLDAEDVASSLNRWLSVYANARKMVGDARFEAAGRTVTIHSSSPIALLPSMLSSSPQAAVIVPSSYVSSLSPGELISGAPGTGPYTIASWSSGAYIELSLFDEYWGEKPSINEIRYNFVPDPVTRRLGLESGLYDFIDTVSSDDIESLQANNDIILHQGGETGSIVLALNKREGICTDHDFRRAVSLFINREELMRACYGDYGYTVRSDYMDAGEALWSVDSSLDPYGREDEAAGHAFLDSSGYDGGVVRILAPNLSNIDKIAVALSSELGKEGINTELTILDWASFIERRKDSSSWDIYVSAASRVVLPIEKGYLFSSAPGGFADKTSSALIEDLSSSSSLEEAAAVWKEAQQSLWEYVPVIIPGHYSTVYASSSCLNGIDFSDGYHFRYAELD